MDLSGTPKRAGAPPAPLAGSASAGIVGEPTPPPGAPSLPRRSDA